MRTAFLYLSLSTCSSSRIAGHHPVFPSHALRVRMVNSFHNANHPVGTAFVFSPPSQALAQADARSRGRSPGIRAGESVTRSGSEPPRSHESDRHHHRHLRAPGSDPPRYPAGPTRPIPPAGPRGTSRRARPGGSVRLPPRRSFVDSATADLNANASGFGRYLPPTSPRSRPRRFWS